MTNKYTPEEFAKALSNLGDQMQGQVLSKAVMAGAFMLEGIIKISMNTGSHSGRSYRRGKKIHVASAPGETPAIDYGNLVNSINSQLVSAMGQRAEAEVGTNVESAPDLEFGTAKMPARPFIRPAVDEHEVEILVAIGEVLRVEIEGAI